MKILGIDPGSIFTGYGIIEKDGNRLMPITSGRIALKKEASLPERLKRIYQELSELIKTHQPEESAIEKTFYSVNANSVIVLSHARAAAMLSCAMNDISIAEYSPNQIKSTTMGGGKAEKEQIAKMVAMILGIRKEMKTDESDALAVAICHAHLRENLRFGTASKKSGRLSF